MPAAIRSQISDARRAEIFHETYGDKIDAANTLAQLVEAAGDYLARIVGRDAADAGMARMIEPVVTAAGGEVANPADWRPALQQSSSYCFSEWPLGQQLHDLAAYAIYGITLHGSEDADELRDHIETLIADTEKFLAATPLEQWQIGADESDELELMRLVRLATNRWALDNGSSVEPSAVAAFGGVSEGRIRNMMAGAKRVFSNEDGRIPAHEALVWLAGRDDFWNSIWREQRLPQYGVKHRLPLERPLFVPVARDGSIFHPGLRRAGGYTIGAKGAETQIDDFGDALAQLQLMPAPYWRRPNSQANWGIVRGIRWERLDTTDLETFAANPDQKLTAEPYA